LNPPNHPLGRPLLSHGNNGYAYATQCFVIRTVPVLLVLKTGIYRPLQNVKGKAIPFQAQRVPVG
jgi:hypothetical protein